MNFVKFSNWNNSIQTASDKDKNKDPPKSNLSINIP